MATFTIDTEDQKSIQAAIAAGITTPELLAEVIDGAELVDDCLVLESGVWHADDGNADISGEYDSGSEAAQAYVDDGEWGEINGTEWISVRVWQSGIDANGNAARVNEDHHKIAIQQPEPECTHADGHDWQSPYEILGGCKENPGVWGSGGGVLITEVCMHCGCARHTDTWAQDRNDGEQGLHSVSYEAGKYADEVRELADAE